MSNNCNIFNFDVFISVLHNPYKPVPPPKPYPQTQHNINPQPPSGKQSNFFFFVWKAKYYFFGINTILTNN